VVLAAAAAVFGGVGVVDPNEPGHYPVCLLLSSTGVYCPACGGLRSVHALVHGEPAAAVGANALAVAAVAVSAAVWLLWFARALRGRPLGLRPRPVHAWSAAVLVLAFTAVRNSPLGTGLAP
jgi:hypothetical protein